MESIIKIFNDVQGRTYDTILDLLFTTKRLLILQILSPRDGRDLRAAPTLLSLFIGSSGIRRSEAIRRYQIASERREKLMHLTPEQIAEEKECVLEVPYAALSNVVFSSGFLGRVVTFNLEREGGKRSISIRLGRDQYDDMWRLLGDLAPQVRVRKGRKS